MTNIEVDIVRRGHMKYKSTLQGSRNFKDYWFIFRTGQAVEDKLLECYQNERESQKKNSTPRHVIHTRGAHTVTQVEPKVFNLYYTDGVVHTFETFSSHEAKEWVFTLNAILFGKGMDGRQVLRFNIEVWSCQQFRYSGPGLLEVRDDQVIVWSQNEVMEVVRWQLEHLRSFKAKHNQLQIIAGSRSSTGEGIFVFGTHESILITHTLETVIYLLAERKKKKKTPPITTPPPIPSSSHNWMKQTLVRGRTDTREAIPGFTDIPGTRGPESSIPISETRSYAHTDHTPHLKVQRLPSRSKSAKDISSIRGDYSLLRPHYQEDPSGDNSSGIYSHIPANNPPTYDQLSAMASKPHQPPPKPLPYNKYKTLPGRGGGEYLYTDTSPQLVFNQDENKQAEFGEIRHIRSRGNSPVNEHPKPLPPSDIYSTIQDEYALLKPVEFPQSSSLDVYNTLDFNDSTEDSNEEELAPPTEEYHHITHNHSPKMTPPTIPPRLGGYDKIEPRLPIPKIGHAPSYSGDYDRLDKTTPTSPPTIPFPSSNKVPQQLSFNSEEDDIEIHYEAPPLPPPPSELSLAELELHYEVSPVLARKEFLERKTSPKVSHKETNPYDEVAYDDNEGEGPQKGLPTHHVIETNEGLEYSKFDRNENRRSHINVVEEAEPYNTLSYDNPPQDNEPYSVLNRGNGREGPLFDGDYSELPPSAYSDTIITPSPHPHGSLDTPSSNYKPAIPPRIKRPTTSNVSSQQTPPTFNEVTMNKGPPPVGEKPVVPPKPKPKPKKNFIVE